MSTPDRETDLAPLHDPSFPPALLPPAPRPFPPTSPEVIITVNGLISAAIGFRLPISHFSSFSDLLAGAHTAFEISKEEFDVHFHIYRKVWDDGNVACEEMSVFGKEEWEDLVSRVFEEGKEIVLWAHFVKYEEEDDEGEGEGEGEGDGDGDGERGVRFASQDEVFKFYKRMPAKRKEKKERKGKRGLNEHSANIYPLGMPIPEERYGRAKYFSGEMVVIPEPEWKAKKVLFPPKIAPPFPGFRASSTSALAVPPYLAATTESGEGHQATGSNDHPTASQEFEYTAAVETAFGANERIEYVDPPPIIGTEEVGEESNSSQEAEASEVAVEDEHSDEGLNDSELDDILKDDWLLEGPGRAEVPSGQTEMAVPDDDEDSSVAETGREESQESHESNSHLVPEEEETGIWTGDAYAERDEEKGKADDSLFVPE